MNAEKRKQIVVPDYWPPLSVHFNVVKLVAGYALVTVGETINRIILIGRNVIKRVGSNMK